MARRRWRVRLVAGALVAGALGVAGSPPAGAVTVTTDDQLAAAFGDPAVDRIDLAGDIDLDCTTGSFLRLSGVPVTIDGHGFAVTDACPDPGTTFLTAEPVTMVDVDLVGRVSDVGL